MEVMIARGPRKSKTLLRAVVASDCAHFAELFEDYQRRKAALPGIRDAKLARAESVELEEMAYRLRSIPVLTKLRRRLA
jgi:hypothetical protein